MNRTMKKIFMLLAVLTAWCGSAAAEGLTVQNITIPKGGEATLEVALENPTTEFAAFQFNVELAGGITVATNDKGKLAYTKGERLDEDFTLSMSQPDPEVNTFRVLGYYTETQPIPGTGGAIILITLKADATLEEGTELACKLSGINLTEPNETKHTPADIAFTVTIGAPADTRTVLDETSTTMPSAATGVDVRVKRTIKANEWSTLCLPFAMSEAQVKEAFGEDVQLRDFTGYEAVLDEAEENVVGITVNFSSLSAIEANHPCLIRVSSPVSEFTVDGVDIDPEEEPVVAAVKRTRRQWSELIGTYVAQTKVPEKTLFLSGNEFWYSTGATKMKGFRAYFDFYDVLTEVDENYANVRFVFSEGETTGVRGVGDGIADHTARDGVYTLQGVKVDGAKTLPKGLYVVDGKKVMVK